MAVKYDPILDKLRESDGGDPSDTVTDETTYGLAPSAGVSTDYSRADHTHGSQDNPVAGADKQVQFNDGGVFGGDSKFAWDKTASSLTIGEGVEILPDNPLGIQANIDSYLQVNIKNDSTGVDASSDYIATADDGDDTQFYADIGISNSGYDSTTWDAVVAHDTYVFGDGGNVAIASLSVGKKIPFFIAQTEHEIHPADKVGEFDSNGCNLPTGKTYRINGVDIVPAGGAGSMVSVELGDVAQVDNSASAMVIDFDGSDFSAGVVGNEVNISLSESVADHVALSDPHTQYQKESEKGVANGYASLDSGGLVPASQLPPSGAGGDDDFGITIDGGGSVITTGSKGYRRIPYDCTVTGWTILGKESGSCVVDVKKSTYAGFPTTSSIAGSEKPTLSSAQKNQDTTLTTWTTSVTADDVLEFVVDSATTVTRVHVFIHVTKT